MYLLLLLAIGASTASPLGLQGTPVNVVNGSRCHCLSLVRLRNERANSTPTAVPTMTSSLSSVRPRNVPVAQRGSSLAISPRTILKSTVSPTCASGLSHSLPLNRARALRPSSRFTNRLTTYAVCLDNPQQNDALAVNLVAKFLLQHAHEGSREALDPAQHSRPHHLTDASTSDSFPPSSSRLV